MGAFVQSLGSAGFGTTTAVITVGANMTPGNSIVVLMKTSAGVGSFVSVTDSKGNSYASEVSAGESAPTRLVTCKSPGTPLSAGDTITVTWSWSLSGQGAVALAAEYLPLGTRDKSGTSAGSNATSGSVSTTAATTSAPEVAIGAVGTSNSVALSVSSPFTKRASATNHINLIDEDLGASGVTPSASFTFALTAYSAVLATFPVTFPQVDPPFIGSVTAVHAPAIVGDEAVPFIASVTAVHAPTLVGIETLDFIASRTAVYVPTLVGPKVDVPFISSRTHVWAIFSLFDPNRLYSGPGNGGETFLVELAPNGTSETATLHSGISTSDTTLELDGDTGFPASKPFVVTIDDEEIYLSPLGGGIYRVRGRGLGNTTAASHSAAADVTWGDHYDLAIRAGVEISHSFTADITSSGTYTYLGWLICFDSSQAYNGTGDRYPMHVTEVLGVFDAGAGVGGSNRCDAAQPNAICTPTGVSDDCPAALSNPSLITSDIAIDDVAVVRYTNPEAYVLDLGPRSVALQSWFGLKRVDASDVDVTLTDPDGYVVDSHVSGPGPAPFSGSVQKAWNPAPELIGIAPDASDAAGHEIDTPNDVPYTTVTLDHTDRNFTISDEKGWPICCLAVRQGNRRIPHWQSWDWRDYAYVYAGFGTDDTFCQLLINRNGIVFGSVPAVELPGSQDIDGPDAVWDDSDYYFATSWYVALFSGPYLVFGPVIGGDIPPGTGAGDGGFVPGVTFTGGTTVTVPPVEGGSGGGISGGESVGLHVWQTI